MNILKKVFFKKNKMNCVEVQADKKFDDSNNPKATKTLNSNDSIYENIPIYSREDFNAAIEDNSDEAFRILYRNCLNGYTTYFDDEWVVGRNGRGELIKSKTVLVTICNEYEKKQRMDTIDKTQNRAVRGSRINDKLFVKFTYDLKDKELFSIHVDLVNEYVEGEIYEDCGTYGGIHFVDIDEIKSCTNDQYTKYGNKIAIVRAIEDHVYYNYTSNYYAGDAVFVEKVMYLDNVETWKYLNNLTDRIKHNKDAFVKYLESMVDGRDYSKSIEYLKSL